MNNSSSIIPSQINDLHPRTTTAAGGLQTEADWHVERTVVKRSINWFWCDRPRKYLHRRERHRGRARWLPKMFAKPL
jgi:hypothetical protein